jgi:tRNA pseudouridine55 synthase
LLLVNKPRGITSFGVISQVRKMTGIRRIGHTGTLDPFADGLLVLAIGHATAAVQFMEGYGKVYELGITFGRTTDSFDVTGKTLSVCEIDDENRAQLRASNFAVLREAVTGLVGDQMQVPPMFSAVKIGGRPLYEYARRGEEIERPSRPVRITEVSVLSISLEDNLCARLIIHCSKGTYIRSLADDLGRQLGCGAVADSLTRLACGPFKLSEAWDLETLRQMCGTSTGQPAFAGLLEKEGILLPISRAFAGIPSLDVPEDTAGRLINGQPVRLSASSLLKAGLPGYSEAEPAGSGLFTVSSRSRLIAVARLIKDEPDGFRLKTERVFTNLADFRQA